MLYFMNYTPLLTSHQALEEILAVLRSRQLMPSTLQLIGLLGVGNNSTAFAADIGGVPRVRNGYAPPDRLRPRTQTLPPPPPKRPALSSPSRQHTSGPSAPSPDKPTVPLPATAPPPVVCPARLESTSRDPAKDPRAVRPEMLVPVSALCSRMPSPASDPRIDGAAADPVPSAEEASGTGRSKRSTPANRSRPPDGPRNAPQGSR